MVFIRRWAWIIAVAGSWGCSGLWGDDDASVPFEQEYVETQQEWEQKERKKKNDRLPFGPQGYRSYSRDAVDDEWDPQAVIFDRSFDYLTPTGSRIFTQSLEFVEEQKKPEFQHYAQPLQCVRNVAHVLGMVGYDFPGSAGYSVPHFLAHVQRMGGRVYHLPQFSSEAHNRVELVEFLAEKFPQGIPTGAIVAGCSRRDCRKSDQYGAHMALLGDKNQYGEVMLYHNNWLRPNNLRGRRIAHMVSLENFYQLLRPREWMPTPWIYTLKDDEGKISDFVSVLPELDDLDPLSEKFHIKIALLPEIIREMESHQRVSHHRDLGTGNQHVNLRIEERKWQVCRAQRPLRDMDVRMEPAGQFNAKVIEELRSYEDDKTFLDYRFEFASLGEKDGWISALVYDAGRYWGGQDVFGSLWLLLDDVECGDKGLTH